MTAEALLPSAKPSDATEAFVMMEMISTPGAISTVTSQLTAPSTTLVTLPLSTFRALIFIVGRILSNGSWRSNRIAIEISQNSQIRKLRPGRIVIKMDDGSETEYGPGETRLRTARTRRVGSRERAFRRYRLPGRLALREARVVFSFTRVKIP
jgi:hypothetical protein